MVAVLPTLLGGALSSAGGFAASKLLGGLFGGGRSRSSSGGGNPYKAQMQMLQKFLNYESPTTNFLDNYVNNIFMDASKDYNDSLRSQNYADNIFGAVESGDMDFYDAQAAFSTAFKPNSEFYATNKYGKFLQSDIGNPNMDQIAQNAFSTNLMRQGTNKEIKALRQQARVLGLDKTPMEFSSFVNSELASSFEGRGKSDYTPREREQAARYGGFGYNPDGSRSYLVNPVGGMSTIRPKMTYGQQYGVA